MIPICFGALSKIDDKVSIFAPNKVVSNVDDIITDINEKMASQAIELKKIDVDVAMKKIKKENCGIEGEKSKTII